MKPVAIIVEDEWLLRQQIVDEFDHMNWTILEAIAAEDALQLLTSNRKIDLLVTDIRLVGEMDGWDLAMAFRAKHPAAPVIYVSAAAPIEAKRVRHSVFLSKPCAPEEVVQAWRTLATGDYKSMHECPTVDGEQSFPFDRSATAPGEGSLRTS